MCSSKISQKRPGLFPNTDKKNLYKFQPWMLRRNQTQNWPHYIYSRAEVWYTNL